MDAFSGARTGQISVPEGANLPDWSPLDDAVTYAVFASDNATSIWVQPFSAGSPQMIAGNSFQNYAPAWSHDGELIAFQSDQGSNSSEIWLMERDGSNAHRLTFSPGKTWSRGPAWSPDDQWLAFVSSQADSAGADFGEVFLIPVGGGDPIQITHTGGNVVDWRVDWGP
jgi:Tol biopolymer transport system component